MSDYTKFDPTNPPPLMTGEPDSFAHRTMTTRIPDIVQQVLADHASQYPVEIIQALQELYEEIKFDRPIRPLEIATLMLQAGVKPGKPIKVKAGSMYLGTSPRRSCHNREYHIIITERFVIK